MKKLYNLAIVACIFSTLSASEDSEMASLRSSTGSFSEQPCAANNYMTLTKQSSYGEDTKNCVACVCCLPRIIFYYLSPCCEKE